MQGLRWSKTGARWVIDEGAPTQLNYENFDPEAWGLLISYWRFYPDKFLDVMEGESTQYETQIIQRIFMRANARYQQVFETASRGTTKSYCEIGEKEAEGILYPGVDTQYAGPSKEQLADILSGVQEDVFNQWPGLRDYWAYQSNSRNNFEMVSNEGSHIMINVARGTTCNSVIAEEVAQSETKTTKAFDHDNFKTAILPAVRGIRMINKMRDPFFQQYQQVYITSAGMTHNDAYEYRVPIYLAMLKSDDAFCIDVPSEVACLCRIREVKWRENLKQSLTADGWMREMDSLWTGTSENPIIRDSVLTESKNMLCMEERHCGNPEAFYIIGYDVSYVDGGKNAKCATAILKCEKQKGDKRNRYLKSLVYVFDNPPPATSFQQAWQLKQLWRRFSMEDGLPTFISIDARAYGKSVVEEMHKRMEDGLPPICCMNHEYPDLEERDALPILYAVQATGGSVNGKHDSDADMIRYAEVEFEQGNVRLLTGNVYEGVEAYKKLHNIRETELDGRIARPYHKTKELIGQIGNLKKVVSGFNTREERISHSINRDMWSALKYALRVAYLLERQNLLIDPNKKSAWDSEFKMVEEEGFAPITAMHDRRRNFGRTIGRMGGNRN